MCVQAKMEEFVTVFMLCHTVRVSMFQGLMFLCVQAKMEELVTVVMLCHTVRVSVFQGLMFLCVQATMEEFFTVLVLCHTVRVDNISGGDAAAGAATIYSASGEDYEYQAASPDEKALVEACRR